jgi:hypothetical protein
MSVPDPVTFTASLTPVLILLPNPFPNAVTPGETLETVLARINAYRAPGRQIVGAVTTDTGRRIPLNTQITNRLVAQEVLANQYLQFGPEQYRLEKACCGTTPPKR